MLLDEHFGERLARSSRLVIAPVDCSDHVGETFSRIIAEGFISTAGRRTANELGDGYAFDPRGASHSGLDLFGQSHAAHGTHCITQTEKSNTTSRDRSSTA